MPRLNRKGELFAEITDVGVFRDLSGGASTTVAGTPPAIDTYTDMTAASGTGLAVGDFYRVGGLEAYPEINRVGALVGAVITPRYPHVRLRAVGDAIVEQEKISLGHINDNGLGISHALSAEDVNSAIRRLWLGHIVGHLKITVDFELLGWNLDNVAVALGMLDTSANITGAGTSADPEKMFVSGAAVREQNDLCWYVDGRRKDGRTVSVHFMGCEVDSTQLQLALARGTRSPLRVGLSPTHAVRYEEID